MSFFLLRIIFICQVCSTGLGHSETDNNKHKHLFVMSHVYGIFTPTDRRLPCRKDKKKHLKRIVMASS